MFDPANDARSALSNLLSCPKCRTDMTLVSVRPDEHKHLALYRCRTCHDVETVLLSSPPRA